MQSRGIPDFFNVLMADYCRQFGGGQGPGAEAKMLYRSDDGRHLAIVGNYPEGLDGQAPTQATEHFEAFYVVKGTGMRTRADGSVHHMVPGDFVILPPDLHGAYRYEPGFLVVCVFWSATDRPLPQYLTHCVNAPGEIVQ